MKKLLTAILILTCMTAGAQTVKRVGDTLYCIDEKLYEIKESAKSLLFIPKPLDFCICSKDGIAINYDSLKKDRWSLNFPGIDTLPTILMGKNGVLYIFENGKIIKYIGTRQPGVYYNSVFIKKDL